MAPASTTSARSTDVHGHHPALSHNAILAIVIILGLFILIISIYVARKLTVIFKQARCIRNKHCVHDVESHPTLVKVTQTIDEVKVAYENYLAKRRRRRDKLKTDKMIEKLKKLIEKEQEIQAKFPANNSNSRLLATLPRPTITPPPPVFKLDMPPIPTLIWITPPSPKNTSIVEDGEVENGEDVTDPEPYNPEVDTKGVPVPKPVATKSFQSLATFPSSEESRISAASLDNVYNREVKQTGILYEAEAASSGSIYSQDSASSDLHALFDAAASRERKMEILVKSVAALCADGEAPLVLHEGAEAYPVHSPDSTDMVVIQPSISNTLGKASRSLGDISNLVGDVVGLNSFGNSKAYPVKTTRLYVKAGRDKEN